MMKTSDAVDNRRRSSFVGSMEEPPKGEEYLYCGPCHAGIDWLRAHDDWSTVPKRQGPERISARDLVISWSCSFRVSTRSGSSLRSHPTIRQGCCLVR